MFLSQCFHLSLPLHLSLKKIKNIKKNTSLTLCAHVLKYECFLTIYQHIAAFAVTARLCSHRPTGLFLPVSVVPQPPCRGEGSRQDGFASTGAVLKHQSTSSEVRFPKGKFHSSKRGSQPVNSRLCASHVVFNIFYNFYIPPVI